MIKVIYESETYKADNLASVESAYLKLWSWFVENHCPKGTTFAQVYWDGMSEQEQETYADVEDALHIVRTEYADGDVDYWGMYDLDTLNNHLPTGVKIEEIRNPDSGGYYLEVKEEDYSGIHRQQLKDNKTNKEV